MRWLLVLTLCASLMALACGGGSRLAVTPTDTACTNDATAAAIHSENSTAIAARGTEGSFSFRVPDSEIECRLRPALLRSDNLPGWKTRDSYYVHDHLDNSPRGQQPFDTIATCGAPANSYIGGLSAQFTRVGGDSALSEQVVAFAPDNAGKFMDGLRHNCALKLAAPPPDSTDFTGGIYAPGPATTFGDESVGVSVSFRFSSDRPAPIDAIFIRRGDVVLAVELIYPDGAGTSVREIAAQLDQDLALVRALPEATPVIGQGCVPPSTPVAGASSGPVQAALLRLDDMPESWAPHLKSVCGFIDGESTCQSQAGQTDQPTAEAFTAFDRVGSALSEDIEEWPAGGAGVRLQSIRDRLGAPFECDVSIGSIRFKWQRQIVDVPGLPEQAVAFRVRSIGLAGGPSGGGEIVIYTVVMVRGNLVAFVSYHPPGSLLSDGTDEVAVRFATEQLSPLVLLAERKLRDAAGD